MILLDLNIFIIIDLYNYFNYIFCFLYIIHVIQSSDCEVFFLINDLSIYLSLFLLEGKRNSSSQYLVYIYCAYGLFLTLTYHCKTSKICQVVLYITHGAREFFNGLTAHHKLRDRKSH